MPDFTVTLHTGQAAQHEEALDVKMGGRTETMRLHEYERVYAVPGLYDEVLRRLEYGSPRKVAELLATAPGVRTEDVRALDLAAGNGVSADPLLEAGVQSLVGMDLIAAARDAALRDRPGAYAEYVAGDVGQPGLVAGLVERHHLNALVCVGGISHIPEQAFSTGWDAFPPGSWLVATAAEDLGDPGGGPYGAWVAERERSGALTDVHTEWFRHRLAMSGQPLEYTALRARKA